MAKLARIYATRTQSCFCELPELDKYQIAAMEPRFNFIAAAKTLAARMGCLDFKAVSRTSSRMVSAELPIPCKHRQTQHIRIEWTLHYL